MMIIDLSGPLHGHIVMRPRKREMQYVTIKLVQTNTSVVNCKVSSLEQMVRTLGLGHPGSARSPLAGSAR
jgi:hypothetical protein